MTIASSTLRMLILSILVLYNCIAHVEAVYEAICSLQTMNSQNPELQGNIELNWINSTFNQVIGDVKGLIPNRNYSLAVHLFGDLSNNGSAKSLGQVFLLLDDSLIADSNGIVGIHIENKNWALSDSNSIIGRSMLLKQQDGTPFAQCVIGIRNIASGEANNATAGYIDPQYKYASCEIHGITNPSIRGRAVFTQLDNELVIEARVCGLSEGLSGFHIHTFGDFSGSIELVGAHYNPDSAPHGIPIIDNQTHVGDLGNIESIGGVANFYNTFTLPSLNGSHSVAGRALIIHAGEDKGSKFQPSGDSGAKIAGCIIGITNTAPTLKDIVCSTPKPQPFPTRKRLVPSLFAGFVLIIAIVTAIIGFKLWRAKIRKLEEERYTHGFV
jgi:Cu-Zn family superoxide dismutase